MQATDLNMCNILHYNNAWVLVSSRWTGSHLQLVFPLRWFALFALKLPQQAEYSQDNGKHCCILQ